jgi:hypothetical protein
MKLIAIATLSVCIALLCLSQSESLSQLAQLELENTTCQTLPCPTQPSPSITLCAEGAINAVQAPRAVPIFVRTRRSPLTLATAQYARARERGSTLCLCNTNHPAGPRIRTQDQWELEGPGGAWPVRPATPAAAPGKHIVCYVWHIVCYDIAYDVVALYCMF